MSPVFRFVLCFNPTTTKAIGAPSSSDGPDHHTIPFVFVFDIAGIPFMVGGAPVAPPVDVLSGDTDSNANSVYVERHPHNDGDNTEDNDTGFGGVKFHAAILYTPQTVAQWFWRKNRKNFRHHLHSP